MVIPNARLCLRHIANTAVSQRKCCYAVIELSHCDTGSKGLDVCVSYVVALDGTLCWAATCLGSRGGIHLIAHFKVKKLLASLGFQHPNSTENCYQPCTDPVPTNLLRSLFVTLLILCCFGVQDLRSYHVKCVYLRKVLDGSLKDTIKHVGK